MEKGVYCLVMSHGPCRIHAGALGDLNFIDGWHVYTGSALGPGGLSRVSRHIRLARGQGGKKHWHIDYLLTNPSIALRYVICAKTVIRLECNLARSLGGIPVPGFGSGDCVCRSHLFFFDNNPEGTIFSAIQSLGLDPIIATLNTLE
jgi:Uri superfamily endonuclease